MKSYYVYILASKKNGTLYIGVTSDLIKRVYHHKNHLVKGFSKKYDVKNLIYFETYSDVEEAIAREKQIKRWKNSLEIGVGRKR